MLMVAPISGSESMLKDSNDEKYGHKIRIKVEKNKLAPPFKVAEFFIDFNHGVARVEEQLLDLGVMYGLIERPNNRSYTYGENKLTSRDEALAFIKENFDEINIAVREAYMKNDAVIIDGEGISEQFPEDVDELFKQEEED
jgi:recombination protein RecA